MTIDASRTVDLGLVGRGIAQSRSPSIHHDAGADAGLDIAYHLHDFDDLGHDDRDLDAVIRQLAAKGYAGVNVTYPFKQAVVALCDALSPAARRIGAVNTIQFRDGKLLGHNTDADGFGWLIDCKIGALRGLPIAQIGAGGAGAASAFAILDRAPARLTLFDTEAGRVAELRDRLQAVYPDAAIRIAPSANDAVAGAAGVVNATPVGMAKLPGTPVDPARLDPAAWVADVIYFPLETALLRAVRARGGKGVNGVAMVVGQAAEAFALFTGIEPDRYRMLARLEAGIAGEAAKGRA